jgi:hypothetical protein
VSKWLRQVYPGGMAMQIRRKSSPVTIGLVKAELGKIKDLLLEEDWFKNAKMREDFDIGVVAEITSSHIDNLTDQDNIYALGERYCFAQGKKQDLSFRNTPTGIILLWSLPVIFLLAAIILNFLVSPSFLSFLLISEISLFPALICTDSWRKRTGWLQVSAEVTKATTDVEKGMRSLIERSIREATHPRFADPTVDILAIGDGSGLSSRVDQADRIATRYRPVVEQHLLRPGGAAVGVTGERGIGKSELLRSFCDASVDKADPKSGGTIQVLVAVPAAFRGIEFLTLLAQELARAVPDYRTADELRVLRRRWIAAVGIAVGILSLLVSSQFANHFPAWRFTPTYISVGLIIGGLVVTLLSMWFFPLVPAILYGGRPAMARHQIRRDAERLTLRLRYAETISSQNEGSISWGSLSLKRAGQRSLSSLPLTEGNLISEIADLADKLERSGYRIVVGIDEMDKLDAGQATEEFLNSVKQLFAVRSCSFIVSVSSSAWAKFVRRGINLRDALDSSLDTIEQIGALDFVEVRSLIRYRQVKMSDSQILFCYVLSGGLPREAMRFARSLAARNRDEEVKSHRLAVVASLVLDGEAKRLIDASRTEISNWPTNDRSIMVRNLDYLYHWWRNGQRSPGVGPVDNFNWLDDYSFSWTRGSLPRISASQREEAQDSMMRLELMLRFLAVVKKLFCAEAGGGIAKYSDPEVVVSIANRLAAVRRVIETDSTGADRALQAISEEIEEQSQVPTADAARL